MRDTTPLTVCYGTVIRFTCDEKSTWSPSSPYPTLTNQTSQIRRRYLKPDHDRSVHLGGAEEVYGHHSTLLILEQLKVCPGAILPSRTEYKPISVVAVEVVSVLRGIHVMSLMLCHLQSNHNSLSELSLGQCVVTLDMMCETCCFVYHFFSTSGSSRGLCSDLVAFWYGAITRDLILSSLWQNGSRKVCSFPTCRTSNTTKMSRHQ